MKTILMAKGLLTYLPGIWKIAPKRRTGGTDSALYCYGVWFKHLTMLWANGLRSIPRTVAELGPGDSLGVGLAALLSGADTYLALDAVEYAEKEQNLRIFEELVPLFKGRAARPEKAWPDYDGHLDADLFPGRILTRELLDATLAGERLDAIRLALGHLGKGDGPVNGACPGERDGRAGGDEPGSSGRPVRIRYMAPWFEAGVIERDSVDVIFSHAVLEHVVDLEETYRALYLWLKPGGLMSHQIDFASHGLSPEWNGYRAYSESVWKIISGKRPYLINRQPCSVHIELIRKTGFEITCLMKFHRTDGIPRERHAGRWRDLSEDDLTCSGVFVQARK